MASNTSLNFESARHMDASQLAALEEIQTPAMRACGCKVFTNAKGKKMRVLCSSCKELYNAYRGL